MKRYISLVSEMMRRHPMLTVILVLSVVAAIAWRVVCPAYKDDWIYMHAALAGADFWKAPGPLLDSWSQLWPTISDHWQHSNGRLVSYLTIALNLCPQWFAALLSGIAAAALPWMAMAFGRWSTDWRGKQPEGVWMMLAVAGVWLGWVAFPWRDAMQSTTFLLAYSLPSAMMLGALTLFYRSTALSGRGFAWACVLTMVTAWMHEGVAAVMIGVMGVATMLWRGPRRRPYYLTLSALAGLLLVMSSPATAGRAASYGAHVFSVRSLVADYFSVGWLAACFLIVVAVMLMVPTWRRRIWQSRSPLIGLAVGVLVSVAMCYRAHMVYRVEWSGLALSLAGLMYVGERVRWPQWNGYQTVALVFFAFFGLFMGQLIGWEYRARTQTLRIEQALTEARGDIVYLDSIATQREVPWYMLGIPRMDAHTEYWANRYMTAHHGRSGRVTLVMPRSYMGRMYDVWPKIDGDNPFRGLPDVPVASENLGELQVEITYSDADSYSVHPFDAPGGGVMVTTLTPAPVLTAEGDTLWAYMHSHSPYPFNGPRNLRTHPVKSIRVVRGL